MDGAGVRLTRVLGHGETRELDPFLMLDAFDSTNPEEYVRGFPWHPHRGIETITYLIEGDVEHGDSLGHRGSIRSGECQWMTAGSGIIHQEMPQPTERLRGLQLWLNLPAANKMVHPHYGDIRAADIPIVHEEGVVVKVIAGEYRGTRGAFQGAHVSAILLDVALDAGATWTLETSSEETVFVYLFEGAVSLGNDSIEAKHSALLGEGEILQVTATVNVRMFVVMARPLSEPIAWGGPIVMNTREELDLAFHELDAGTFIKHDAQ